MANTSSKGMKLDIYINYNGNCAQAFRFYEQHLGGRITLMSTFKELPDQANIPDDRKNDILHARIEIGDTVVRGADIPHSEPMRSAYLTLIVDSVGEAERLYALLSDGGEIFMKMEETFFASRFAMLRDKFGTSWMLLHERKEMLMEKQKSKFQTIDEYIAAFPSEVRERLEKIRQIIRKTAPEAEETISYQIPTFKLNGTYLIYFSAGKNHIALYPATAAMESSIKELPAYRSGKGTIRFPADQPLPLPLIRKIAAFRLNENREKEKMKTAKKQK